jgi:hypothetical protein
VCLCFNLLQNFILKYFIYWRYGGWNIVTYSNSMVVNCTSLCPVPTAHRELMLVADALRLGGAILGMYPNMLAPQLVSRLLPEIGPNPNVKMLLKQCDETGPEHCALLPLYHCLHTPGGPLKVPPPPSCQL